MNKENTPLNAYIRREERTIISNLTSKLTMLQKENKLYKQEGRTQIIPEIDAISLLFLFLNQNPVLWKDQ